MRFGITAKLFGAILITNIVMAVAFGIAIHVSTTNRFRDYIQEREHRRLLAISQVLATEYSAQGSWKFLHGDDEHWRDLIRHSSPEFGGPRGRPPQQAARPSSLPGRRLGLEGLSLEDQRHEPVVGQPIADSDALLVQPVVSGGVTVGWIKRQRPPPGGPDSRFLEELRNTGWVIAGVALLLAAFAALPMARRLIAPIRRLEAATLRLSTGDFTSAVEVTSQDELGRLTQEFNHLSASLRDAEERRRGFLADVSHELRTPLTILRGELDAIHEGVLAATPEAIESLRGEVAKLEHLINDLYDLAVADLGPAAYQFGDVDVAALLSQAAAAFSERLAARKLAIDVTGIPSDPVIARGDSRRLVQMVNNLLENSVRYTDPGGRIVLALRHDGDDAVIDVMDSAPGVPQDLLGKLFDRLFRVEPSRSREFGGAGLGLALCRSIVHAHGGSIVARAAPLGGLWIQVSIPRDARGDEA